MSRTTWRACLVLAAVLGTLATIPAVRAQDAAQLVKAAKSATALVIRPGDGGTGTAFCIDRAGLFITNEHVVRGVREQDDVTLVLHPGEPGERVLKARVSLADRTRDLAVLTAARANDLAALPLGDEAGLAETQQLTALGYPFGRAMALAEGEYPNVTVNVVRVSSLRRLDDALELIQIDSQLNPGNSGGPLVDARGRVVGVIQAGIVGGGINFAIPVGRVTTLLQTPNIVFTPPTVTHERRTQPHEFVVRVIQFVKNPARLTVQLRLGSGDDAHTVTMQPAASDPSRFVARVAPVRPRKAASARVPVSITFAGAAVEGQAEDVTLRIGERSLKLSEIQQIEADGDLANVLLKDGTELTRVRLPVVSIKTDVGGQVLPFELSKVKKLSVFEPDPEPDRVKYAITVLRGGRPVAGQEGEIGFTAAAPAADAPQAVAAAPSPQPGEATAAPPAPPAATQPAATLPTDKPQFDGDQLVVTLPEPFAKSAVAGAGRYLVFYLKGAQKVLVINALTGAAAAEIPGVTEDVLIAGGRDKLLLVLPGQKLVQRWSLATFKREKVAPLPGKGTTRIAAIGCNSNGPLLLGADDTVLLDVDTLRPMQVDGRMLNASGQYGYTLRVSADGSTFGGIVNGIGPVGYEVMHLRGRSATVAGFESTSNANRWAQPSADGGLIFLPGSYVHSRHLARLEASRFEGSTIYATVDPRYFIAVRFADDPAQKRMVTHVAVCTAADRRVVHTLVGLPEMAPRGNTQDRDDYVRRLHFGEERFFYLPWAGLLVALDWDNSRVILRKLDVIDALRASGVDYLFVESVPPDTAVKGRSLTYPIAVQSKAGGVTYRLESGPPGMTVAADGVLRWNVPAGYADETAAAVVAVSDSAGEEVLHSIELKVVAADTRTAPARARRGA